MAFAFDEKFTRDALQSLKMAQEEALRLNHGYIGTEHLLLGLMRNEDTAAASTLADLGLTLGQVRIAVVRVVGRGEQHATRLQLTDQTKDVMKMAIEEARNSGDDMVDTQHLLMALLRLDKSMASAVLESLNISVEVVRRRLGARMSQDSSTDRTPALPERRSRGKKSEESVLEQLSVDLTAKAQNGELDPVIGRETEIERVIQILARRTKNNPALIGLPGVGKSAIVEGLAQRIIKGQVPRDLQGKRGETPHQNTDSPVMRWLSRDQLPAYVGSFHKVNLWARPAADGPLAVALVNSSFDAAEQLELVLHTDHSTVTVFDMQGRAATVAGGPSDGPYRHFQIPAVEPWSMCLVVTER